jgi:hypothetical protein
MPARPPVALALLELRLLLFAFRFCDVFVLPVLLLLFWLEFCP